MPDNFQRHRVFSGKDLLVVHQPTESDTVVVTFTWGKFKPIRNRFYADDLLGKLGYSAVGIVSSRPHWYVTPEMPAAIEAVRALAGRHPVRVGYGFSMGAYGVLRFGRELALDHALAFSPQWSIDPEEAPWDSRKDWGFVPAMKGMGVRPEHLAGRVFLFHDPLHQVDALHARSLSSQPPVTSVPMRHCSTTRPG